MTNQDKNAVPQEWIDYCRSGKKPADIPERPDLVYAKSWKGWDDFLGIITLEARASAIAERANQCCNRSDGYEEDIKQFAFAHLLEVYRNINAFTK